MKVKKLLKVLSFSMLFSFMLTGCAKDGKNGTDGKDGINGIDGINGLPGENGNTWYSGDLMPTNSLGVDGDFYLNSSDKKIYKKENGIWKVVVDLIIEEEPENKFSAGTYINKQIIGDFSVSDEFLFNDEHKLLRYVQCTEYNLDGSTNLKDMNLIPVGLNGDTVILAVNDGMNVEISLDEDEIYNVNSELLTSQGIQHIVGQIKGDMTTIEVVLSEIRDHTAYVSSYTFDGDLMNIMISGVEKSYYIKSVSGSGNDKKVELGKTVYIKESEEVLVYGTYTNGNDNVVISKDRIYVYLNERKYTGSFVFVDGSIENGTMYLEAKFDDVFISCALDLFSRNVKFNVINYTLNKYYYDSSYENYIGVEDGLIIVNGDEFDEFEIKSIENHPELKYLCVNEKEYLIDWLNDSYFELTERNHLYLGKGLFNELLESIYYINGNIVYDIYETNHYVDLVDYSVEISFKDRTLTLFDYINGVEETVSFEDISEDGEFFIGEVLYTLHFDEIGRINSITYTEK